MEQKDADLSADERRFLEEFPILKEKLEEDIRKFRARADDIEKKQKILTEASLVTNSVSAVSGAVSLLGLALTPATGGGSLVLLGCVETLGSIAGATNIVTNLAKEVQNAQAEAGSPEPTDGQRSQETEGKGRLYYVITAGKLAYAVYASINNIKDVKEKIRASKTASAHPLQAAGAEGIKTTSQVTVESGRKLPKAFERIKLLMTRHPRLLNGTVTGISLYTCVAALLKDWKELKEGAKSKSAEKLKAKAGELEKELLDLSQRYERLQQKVRLRRPSRVGPEGVGALTGAYGHQGSQQGGKEARVGNVCLDVPEAVGHMVALEVHVLERGSSPCTGEDAELEGVSWTETCTPNMHLLKL